jgi:hypothetical protein
MLGPCRILLAALPLVATPLSAAVSEPGTTRSAPSLEQALAKVAPTINPDALHAALTSYSALAAKGEITSPFLTVIDYGLSSRSKRMWVFDVPGRRLVFHELVAHGRNSGGDLASSFSNEEGSHMTSLGAFVTGDTYVGSNGYSLRLRGMDAGRNDRAEARAIVMHGAPYVSEEVASKMSRLGRSFGCPAVRLAIARELIDGIKGRSLLYAWHPSMLAPAVVAAVSRKTAS